MFLESISSLPSSTPSVSASLSSTMISSPFIISLASAAWATETKPKNFTSWKSQPSMVPRRWSLEDECPVKLEGVENLVSWKKHVVLVLIDEELLGFVTNPNQDDPEKDRRLQAWLLSSLSEDLRSLMMGKEHAWEVWSGVLKYCREELMMKIRTFLSAAQDIPSESLPSPLPVASTNPALLRTFNSLIELGETLPKEQHLKLLQTPDITALRALYDGRT
ncbi:hypothetical protein DEO72_LG11g658 [Vigna unguiculata]|uniref:Uncharacterized protein n=1 Tax=Vigna unguiculata TaxID=3917 RepID=A0A4D6NIH8_VIGUN|nr:hypothetical protein DEO72_LG11g657 [Vigna unguiculata]QCE13663.1 hypothetical protein DEO72_LG11g658 [Vigna unguiculata]